MARDSARPLIDSSVTWSATLFAFLLVVLKVLVVSHFDATTALGVLRSVGVASVIIAAISVSLVPVSVFVLAVVNSILTHGTPSPTEKVVLEAAFLVTSLLLVYFAPLVFIPVVLFLMDKHYVGPVARWRRQREARRPLTPEEKSTLEELDATQQEIRAIEGDLNDVTSRAEAASALDVSLVREATELNRRSLKVTEMITKQATNMDTHGHRMRRAEIRSTVAYLVFIAAMSFMMVADDRPWLPAEHFVLTPSSSQMHGYALDVEEGRTLVLRESPRFLTWLDTREIQERRFCLVQRPGFFGTDIGSPISFLTRSITAHVAGTSPYLDCSELDA